MEVGVLCVCSSVVWRWGCCVEVVVLCGGGGVGLRWWCCVEVGVWVVLTPQAGVRSRVSLGSAGRQPLCV